jgi:hypothetical protein
MNMKAKNLVHSTRILRKAPILVNRVANAAYLSHSGINNIIGDDLRPRFKLPKSRKG